MPANYTTILAGIGTALTAALWPHLPAWLRVGLAVCSAGIFLHATPWERHATLVILLGQALIIALGVGDWARQRARRSPPTLS